MIDLAAGAQLTHRTIFLFGKLQPPHDPTTPRAAAASACRFFLT
jgi:hypothetical protein